jgi:solute carrier family 25 protein 33/36
MNPLWMMKTRFQIIADPTVGQKTFRNYGDVARVIWKEEGPAGFFKGLTASYVGCFEGAIQWIVYEKLKSAFTARNELSSSKSGHNLANGNSATVGTYSGKSALLSRTKTLPLSPLTRSSKTSSSSGNGNQQVTKQSVHPAQLFLAAAVAKFTAIVATYPHEVVRTRLREQAVSGVFKYRGFVGTLRTIAREEGTRGLYGGMGMHLLRSVPNTAIMFLSFELVKKWVDQQPTLQQQQKQQSDSDGPRSAAVVAKGLTVHGRKK